MTRRDKTTTEAAQELGVRAWTLIYLIKTAKIPMPPRNSALDFVWGKTAIQRARKVLAARKQKVTVA
jgi:hypothetical protein